MKTTLKLEGKTTSPANETRLKLPHDQKMAQISEHFSKIFTPTLAHNDTLKAESFKIRHQAYCEELKYESINTNKMETDEFDKHSIHCLIKHIPSGEYAGTVRVVHSENKNQLLPIEKYCLNTISQSNEHPNDFPRNEVCEISRLAVLAKFRKRRTDQYPGSSIGMINERVCEKPDLRCFPFISNGLYLSVASICSHNDIKHCFVMMEPKLQRNLRIAGIPFKQVGPIVEYHGQRAPYYINRDLLTKGLNTGFKTMLACIEKEISLQSLYLPKNNSDPH